MVAARSSGGGADVPLLQGDVIRALNGHPITTLERLRTALKALQPGAPVVLQIQREWKLQFMAFSLEP